MDVYPASTDLHPPSGGGKVHSIRTKRPADEHTKGVTASFGRRVRELRKKIGLSQEELALKASLDRSYVGQVERGECNITVSNIYKLASGLETKPSDLLPTLEEHIPAQKES